MRIVVSRPKDFAHAVKLIANWAPSPSSTRQSQFTGGILRQHPRPLRRARGRDRAQGNLRFVRRDAGSGEIVSETRYDVFGRPIEVIDLDRGTEQRFYNAASEVIVGLDARGMRTEQHFDALGRVWRWRSGPGEAFMGGGGSGLPFGDGFEAAPLAPTGAGGNSRASTPTRSSSMRCAPALVESAVCSHSRSGAWVRVPPARRRAIRQRLQLRAKPAVCPH